LEQHLLSREQLARSIAIVREVGQGIERIHMIKSRLSILVIADVLNPVRNPALGQDADMASMEALWVPPLWELLLDQQSLVDEAALVTVLQRWNSFAAKGEAGHEAATAVDHRIALTLTSPGRIKTQLAVSLAAFSRHLQSAGERRNP
jgi:hypothetical protein